MPYEDLELETSDNVKLRCYLLSQKKVLDAVHATPIKSDWTATNDEAGSAIPMLRILYGQSIGGAVSIDLASRNPSKIKALILENTFTSLPSLIPHALPVLGPFSFLCHQKWDSASKVPLIPATTPILMLSGAKDEIVPKEHMRALWEIVARRGEKQTAGGREYKVGLERAKFMEFEDGGHSERCFLNFKSSANNK
ncbi:hypothetical protein DXG03_003694 [Asterophora parasitica]|uniref:Serine aminopeptidase S33 domain-containing protein n=1 Tax=Asterophora parasitica TaxID=117018 RepID=A0A9P7GAR3_9AGAR|nr:hypothetical protein DXG03_003694 [Asterophora parasitica]